MFRLIFGGPWYIKAVFGILLVAVMIWQPGLVSMVLPLAVMAGVVYITLRILGVDPGRTKGGAASADVAPPDNAETTEEAGDDLPGLAPSPLDWTKAPPAPEAGGAVDRGSAGLPESVFEWSAAPNNFTAPTDAAPETVTATSGFEADAEAEAEAEADPAVAAVPVEPTAPSPSLSEWRQANRPVTPEATPTYFARRPETDTSWAEPKANEVVTPEADGGGVAADSSVDDKPAVRSDDLDPGAAPRAAADIGAKNAEQDDDTARFLRNLVAKMSEDDTADQRDQVTADDPLPVGDTGIRPDRFGADAVLDSVRAEYRDIGPDDVPSDAPVSPETPGKGAALQGAEPAALMDAGDSSDLERRDEAMTRADVQDLDTAETGAPGSSEDDASEASDGSDDALSENLGQPAVMVEEIDADDGGAAFPPSTAALRPSVTVAEMLARRRERLKADRNTGG